MRICLFLWLGWVLLGSAWAQPTLLPAERIDTVRQQQDPLLLDVRSLDEIQRLGSLPGYVHIPLDELPGRLDELPKDRLILTL